MRRVDDDQPRPRSDRRVDRGEIEIEGRRLQRDLARHRVGGEQHRLVAEPGRLGEDRLVAGVEHQPERHHDGGEGAGGQRDVGRLEGKTELAAQPLAPEKACGAASLVL